MILNLWSSKKKQVVYQSDSQPGLARLVSPVPEKSQGKIHFPYKVDSKTFEKLQPQAHALGIDLFWVPKEKSF